MGLQPPESYEQGLETRKRRKSGELSALVVSEALKPDRMSWDDFAIKHNLSRSTVYTVVKKMKKAGRIPKTRLHQQKSTLTKDGKPIWEANLPQKAAPAAPISELIEALGDSSALNPATRRAILAIIATQSTDTNKISAITKLEELDRQAGNRIGPPPPETEDEYVARLGQILRLAGPEMVQKAVNWAAEHQEASVGPVEGAAEGNLGSSEPENRPTEGCGLGSVPATPESGQVGGGLGPVPLPTEALQVGGGLDAAAEPNGP